MSSQSDLCLIFPKLYSDLLEGKTDTLHQFVVKRKHFEVPEVACELEKIILQKMCTSAASVIKLQCRREYLPESEVEERATNISNLSEEDKKVYKPTTSYPKEISAFLIGCQE